VDFPLRIPFVEQLGFELLRFSGGQAQVALMLREEQTNSWGVAHGGVTMTLLDVVMAHAARSPSSDTDPSTLGVVTVEMKTSFTRPGSGRLLADGRLLHRTPHLAFCEGQVRNDAGELLAHATGTFKYMRALPAGGRRILRPNASD
jgi:uncharacterized protein (TIGR00369 family)